MPSWWWCVVVGAVGCSPTPAAKAPAARPAASAAKANPAPRAVPEKLAPAQLQKTFTGQPQPSLVVKNGFPIAQHVFIDWIHQASLAPAASQRFELAAGTHTITCADSTDPDDHPAAITEAFDTGYAYVYELRPGS